MVMSLTNSRSIKHFKLEGTAVDQEAILRLRKQLEDLIVDEMRSRGWVPVIDLLPQLYWEYNLAQNEFSYEVLIYGTFVGKRKSHEILGMLDSRPILMEHDDGGTITGTENG